jgi:hypothetical protein
MSGRRIGFLLATSIIARDVGLAACAMHEHRRHKPQASGHEPISRSSDVAGSGFMRFGKKRGRKGERGGGNGEKVGAARSDQASVLLSICLSIYGREWAQCMALRVDGSALLCDAVVVSCHHSGIVPRGVPLPTIRHWQAQSCVPVTLCSKPPSCTLGFVRVDAPYTNKETCHP